MNHYTLAEMTPGLSEEFTVTVTPEMMDAFCTITGDVSPIHMDADYAKGNRFFHLDEIHQMPAIRLFGNAVLSFMSKVSTGYWGLFDPTNGYTAIQTRVASHLPMDQISKRYLSHPGRSYGRLLNKCGWV